MRLLRLELDGITLYERSRLVLDFFASDRIARPSDGRNAPGLTPTTESSSLFTQNVIAFAGVNASGKTTTLNCVKFALGILAGDSIERAWRNSAASPFGTLPLSMFANPSMSMKVAFWHDEACYLLESTISSIGHCDDDSIDEDRYEFEEELLWKYSGGNLSKKAIANLDILRSKATLVLKRSERDQGVSELDTPYVEGEVGLEFLRSDESIASRFSRRSRSFFRTSGDYSRGFRMSLASEEVVAAFDSRIESLLWDGAAEVYHLKFFGKDELVLGRGALERVLSKGTMVGSSLVYSALNVLRSGTYLIVDEIENSLNKALVQGIVDLFTTNSTNPNGATLIFSTHYPEILDGIARKDNVFLLVRNRDFETVVVKYADRVKRVENKKSEIIFSNFIDGTAPNYSDIEAMRRYVKRQVSHVE